TMNLSETSIITIGYGLYSLLLVGIIFFTAFFLEERIVKRPQFNAQISKTKKLSNFTSSGKIFYRVNIKNKQVIK
ncbi:MAG: hypothetical protein N3A64_03080, partial [Desulfobacterota bacterium]|nr:hypothetical protein [Thermodesulfobacteriota bacterium]